MLRTIQPVTVRFIFMHWAIEDSITNGMDRKTVTIVTLEVGRWTGYRLVDRDHDGTTLAFLVSDNSWRGCTFVDRIIVVIFLRFAEFLALLNCETN